VTRPDALHVDGLQLLHAAAGLPDSSGAASGRGGSRADSTILAAGTHRRWPGMHPCLLKLAPLLAISRLASNTAKNMLDERLAEKRSRSVRCAS
jgi:hypothetical protein